MAKEKFETMNDSTVEKAKEFSEVIFNEDGSVTSPEVTLWNPYEALRYFDEQNKLVLKKIREENEPVIKEISDLLLKSWELDKQWLDEFEIKFLIDFMQKYGIWKSTTFISYIVDEFYGHCRTTRTESAFDKEIKKSWISWDKSDNNTKFELIKDFSMRNEEKSAGSLLCTIIDAIKHSNEILYEQEKNKFYAELAKQKKTSVIIHLI